VRLAPDHGHLTPGERAAASKLLEVGAIFRRRHDHRPFRDAALGE
jgi:hypothetical protein